MKKGKRVGAKDTRKRKQRVISNEHREKIRSSLAKRNNQKKEADKREKLKQKERNKARFISALTGRNDTAKNDTEIEVDDTSTVVDADIDYENTTEDNNISIEEIVPPDYECELDEEPFDEYGDECNVSLLQNEILPVEGVMQDFLKKVQNRLKIEVRNERSNDSLCKKLLLEHLKSNN